MRDENIMAKNNRTLEMLRLFAKKEKKGELGFHLAWVIDSVPGTSEARWHVFGMPNVAP